MRTLTLKTKAVLTGLAVVGMSAVGMVTAGADPITCPSGQTSVKTAAGWDCQNNGGNLSNAEDPRNPNAGKDDF